MTTQERIEQERNDVIEVIEKITDCKVRIHRLTIQIKATTVKDKKNRLKAERKNERRALKTFRKNLDKQIDELSAAKYIQEG